MLAEEWRQIVASLAASVKELRTLLGWSQQRLADRAVTSQGTISRMETGTAEDVPFHSVVVVIRALTSGMTAMDVPISPSAQALIQFCKASNSFITASPVDQDLVTVAEIVNQLPYKQRRAFMRLVRAAAELVGDAEDSIPVPPPSSNGVWHG